MTTSPIRVMCVDDNRLVADAVERHIVLEPRFSWVGWVSRSEDVIRAVHRAAPDVVLLDIDMPGRSVFDVLHELTEMATRVRVVMFSGYVQREYIDRAVEAGAWGYVSKHASIGELLAAIEKVVGGAFAFTDDVMAEQRRVGPRADRSRTDGIEGGSA